MIDGRTLRAWIAGAILAMPVALAAAEEQRPSAEAALTAGVVKKVDRGAGKVTISHEAIENLGMPKMTMVFRVKDAAMLGQLKEGDRINFAADNVNGAYTLMRFETAK